MGLCPAKVCPAISDKLSLVGHCSGEQTPLREKKVAHLADGRVFLIVSDIATVMHALVLADPSTQGPGSRPARATLATCSSLKLAQCRSPAGR